MQYYIICNNIVLPRNPDVTWEIARFGFNTGLTKGSFKNWGGCIRVCASSPCKELDSMENQVQ